jgi:hypothetical protein
MSMGNPVTHSEVYGHKAGPDVVTFAEFSDPEGNVLGISESS